MTDSIDDLIKLLRERERQHYEEVWTAHTYNNADADLDSRVADALEALQAERDAAKEQVSLLTANTNWWSKPWVPVPLDTMNELMAERLKRQQAEYERDSILEDLAGVQARLDTAEAELSVLKSGNVAR